MTHQKGTHCDTDALNSLLRGEQSAIETYQIAMPKFDGKPEVQTELRRIHDEHIESANTLKFSIHDFGGKPSQGSGPWGDFAHAVTGAAKVIGPETVLSTLKQGEQHGINDYESTLKNEDVSEECKATIRNTLIPRCREHISTLDRLQTLV
jgi:hypothetical protein